jgi:RNA polymerase sigma-70 factor (ECF subfamily)
MSFGYEQVSVAETVPSDLVARIAAGDRDAELEFVRRFEAGVRVLMRRHCRPADPIVDDLVQEVLAGVIERLRAGAVHDAGTLPAYLQATIVYTASAEYRRRHPTLPVETIADLPDSDSPVAHADAAQLAALLRAVLAELPVARDREILTRFYLNQDDKDVVCRDLCIDPSHFHRVVFRARERFRTLLEHAGIGDAR